MRKYNKNCLFWTPQYHCYRNVEHGGNVAPCLYAFDCPWFQSDPTIDNNEEDNNEEA